MNKSLVAVAVLVLSGVASAQCAIPGPYVIQYGNPLLPVVNVTSGDFTMGANTVVRLQAGLAFIEGFACVVAQEDDNNQNWAIQVPGIAGDLMMCIDRPFMPFFEGQLLGGLNAGNSPLRTFSIPNVPALCGFRVAVQGYVITEILTNPTFTRLLVGVFH